jgi:hypothetical protein
MQRRERQMRAETFRPKAYDDGSKGENQSGLEPHKRIAIDVQVIDKNKES